MKMAITALTLCRVVPKIRVSLRVQTTSYTSPAMPESERMGSLPGSASRVGARVLGPRIPKKSKTHQY